VTTRSFGLTYDYRCPFAKNLHLHVLAAKRAGGDFTVDYEPWSLNQPHRADGDPDVWDDPAKEPDLVALAASVSVRDLQSELFPAAHEALFIARHVNHVRLNTFAEVADTLQSVGVDTDAVAADLATRRPYGVIGASHERLAPLEHFGVPTIVIGDRAVFVRYMLPPDGEDKESVPIVDELLDLMENRPLLNEFKYTTRSN
jgi:hypothetical protein